MSLLEDNARFALLKAIIDAATAELGKIRSAHFEQLLARYDVDRTKKFSVTLPGDDTVVAEITLTVPKRAVQVTDDAALLDWLKATHPGAVDTEEIPEIPEQTIPAVPARTEYAVNGKAWTELAKQFKATSTGDIVDTTTGMVVPGMTMPKQAKPKAFAVTYPDNGRELLADAYHGGQLNDLVAGTTLPAIEAAPVVERRLEVVPEPAAEMWFIPATAAQVFDGDPVDDEDGQNCGKCGDQVHTVSSAGLCDGCEEQLENEACTGQEEPFDPGDFDTVAEQRAGGWY